nr:bifunctional ADP-dependent NAD(P)H-hydrate dehydratase/NAD(P)H-hydrate epimerase [Chitinophagales bacterium]
MKILSVPQIRQADSYTIEHEPISSGDLMERASAAFSNWFVRCFTAPQTIHIICGTGNNGGDGLCIARQLYRRAYNICVHIV